MMNLIKKIKPGLLLFLLVSTLLVLIPLSRAADYSITCNDSGCTSPGTAIFSQTNVAPGDVVTKSIEIISQYGETLNMDMTTTKNAGTDDDFLDVVAVLVVEDNGMVRFNDSLRQFLNNPAIDLGSLNAFKSKEVFITLSLQDVGNEFQGKQAKFDIPVTITVQAPAVGGAAAGTGGAVAGAAASPSPSPTVAGVFTGPLAGILGEATPSAELEALLPGLVKGKQYWRWWPWLLLLLAIIFFWLKWKKKHRRMSS